MAFSGRGSRFPEEAGRKAAIPWLVIDASDPNPSERTGVGVTATRLPRVCTHYTSMGLVHWPLVLQYTATRLTALSSACSAVMFQSCLITSCTRGLIWSLS